MKKKIRRFSALLVAFVTLLCAHSASGMVYWG